VAIDTVKEARPGSHVRSPWAVVCAVAVLLAAMLMSGACYGHDDRQAAKSAGDHWLKLVADGQYEKTWDEGSQLLKAATIRSHWVASMKETGELWGPVVSRELLETKYLPKHEYSAANVVVDTVIFSYRTTFQNKAASKEDLAVVRDADGVWRVYLYLSGMRL